MGDRDLYPELQIWRPIGSGNYTKMQSSTVNIITRSFTNRYEYIPDSPLDFRVGDIVGIYQPSQSSSRLYLHYYRGNEYNQLRNYYFQGNNQKFQNFSTDRVMSERILPLVAVEVNNSKCLVTYIPNSELPITRSGTC